MLFFNLANTRVQCFYFRKHLSEQNVLHGRSDTGALSRAVWTPLKVPHVPWMERNPIFNVAEHNKTVKEISDGR